MSFYPDNNGGANERGGFIDAPDTNAKNNMSKPTIAPITIPLKPLRPFVYAMIKLQTSVEQRHVT
jgi:hypothetical protein